MKAMIGTRVPPVGTLVELVGQDSVLFGMRGVVIEGHSVKWHPEPSQTPAGAPNVRYTQPWQDSWLFGSVQIVEGVWGEWDSPATDHLSAITTPVGFQCRYCGFAISKDDAGGAVTLGMGVHHRECALRAVLGGIGHHINHDKYCRSPLGPDAGLHIRESSLLVWDAFHGATITEHDLDLRGPF